VRNRVPYLFIVTLALLVWFPIVGDYIMLRDDPQHFHASDGGLRSFVREAFEANGFWRLLGNMAVSFGLRLAPNAFQLLTVLMHTASACLAFSIALCLLRHAGGALF